MQNNTKTTKLPFTCLLASTVAFIGSSNLKIGTFNGLSQTLVLEFHNGDVYQYSSIFQEEFQGLCEAPSAGKYFCEHIRNNPNYPYEKLLRVAD